MGNYKIVIADDDRETIELLTMTLELDKYEVTAVYDGKSALKKVQEIKPDMVLLDYDMPDMNGHDVCRNLKSSNATRYIPVIILSGTRTKVYDKINGLEAGADDYMIKPFDPDELRARIVRSIQKTKEIISLNPLTKLPGSTRIEEEIIGRLDKGSKFAVGYVDLDHFKAYNDVYGYKKGDDVIHLLHEVIFEGVNLHGTPGDFVGHIGGDDFIVVTLPEKVDAVCEYVTRNFDLRIPAYYSQEDREKGCISTLDRRRNQRKFPIMTVSIGISSNEKREIRHYAELIEVLIEMKKYAKSLEEREGSTFVKDKRTSQSKFFGMI
jgi:diguanylate cyclase (GGDEF)-like protein